MWLGGGHDSIQGCTASQGHQVHVSQFFPARGPPCLPAAHGSFLRGVGSTAGPWPPPHAPAARGRESPSAPRAGQRLWFTLIYWACHPSPVTVTRGWPAGGRSSPPKLLACCIEKLEHWKGGAGWGVEARTYLVPSSTLTLTPPSLQSLEINKGS